MRDEETNPPSIRPHRETSESKLSWTATAPLPMALSWCPTLSSSREQRDSGTPRSPKALPPSACSARSEGGAFERFIRRGNGFVGIHSATDTEYDWPWYGELVGAYFRAHPEIQPALIRVEAAHPSTMGLPSTWMRTDEWYGFRDNPRSRVTVLLTLDESSYMPGASTMGDDHPIAWYHQHDGGRAFYTALGHTEASYAEPLFLGHLAGGVEWAARR
jgi:type 1 glutamine amidotransferase